MAKLATLKKHARESAILRGHKLDHLATIRAGQIAEARCLWCGCSVSVNTHPMPNDVEIGGDAVAIACTYVPCAPAPPSVLYNVHHFATRKVDAFPRGTSNNIASYEDARANAMQAVREWGYKRAQVVAHSGSVVFDTEEVR